MRQPLFINMSKRIKHAEEVQAEFFLEELGLGGFFQLPYNSQKPILDYLTPSQLLTLHSKIISKSFRSMVDRYFKDFVARELGEDIINQIPQWNPINYWRHMFIATIASRDLFKANFKDDTVNIYLSHTIRRDLNAVQTQLTISPVREYLLRDRLVTEMRADGLYIYNHDSNNNRFIYRMNFRTLGKNVDKCGVARVKTVKLIMFFINKKGMTGKFNVSYSNDFDTTKYIRCSICGENRAKYVCNDCQDELVYCSEKCHDE